MRALFGIETEYALSGVVGGMPVERNLLLRGLMRRARRRPHLTDGDSGIFLANGARFYVDHGGHPELATPECCHPDDLVRYAAAGDAFLADLLADFRVPGVDTADLLLTKCNVTYGGSPATWGCHESYLHRRPDRDFAEDLLPHLVSRIVFTGGGGFNPLTPGLEFTLSPRAAFFRKVVSSNSTCSRGLLHTKEEPLAAAGYGRLHVIFGEGLCSHRATWLKVGTTALVVAMAEAGVRPGPEMRLADPLRAVRSFAADPQLSCRVPLAGGGRIGAVAIQRHYLRAAEQHAGTRRLPAWADAVCREWRAVLDRLVDDPTSQDHTLDWAIKRRVYTDRLCRRGFSWEELARWRPVLVELASLTEAEEEPEEPNPLVKKRKPRAEVRELRRRTERSGLDWERLEPLQGLRRELFEIDTRFSQLGERGIFAALDTSGALRHRVVEPEAVEQAKSTPPADNRAALRGDHVWRLSDKPERYRCGWMSIRDLEKDRQLLMSDPFRTRASWANCPDSDKRRADALLRRRLAVALGRSESGGGSDE